MKLTVKYNILTTASARQTPTKTQCHGTSCHPYRSDKLSIRTGQLKKKKKHQVISDPETGTMLVLIHRIFLGLFFLCS